jgi:hypothetical protein
MIPSASSSDRAAHAESVVATGSAVSRPIRARADHISTEGAAFLRAELARQPEIRPEVMAIARLLAADAGYPTPAIIRSVAAQVLASPDLSEDAA